MAIQWIEVSQPISKEDKMVYGLNQATRNFENLAILYLSNFWLCFRTDRRRYIAWKKWIISVTVS